jgi:hypothetical protein
MALRQHRRRCGNGFGREALGDYHRSVDGLPFVEENEMDIVLGGAHPNPRRVGCPPQRLLIELARRERSISDPWYDHLSECSPCYREVRALQQAAGEWRGTVH